MRVLFRVDASISIGSGHVMRCLTLAHALKSRGAQVLFICRASGGDLGGLLRDQGIEVAWLVAPSAKADAEQTLDVMALHAFGTGDWVVLDHYGLGRAWESTIRRSGSRILVIDDLANRPHDCDLLLDQNLVADYQARYAGLVGEETITLLGPRYAMLQPSYREAHQTARRRSGRPRRIMVFFGGGDLPDMTTKVVEALLQRPEDVVVDMVVGAANPKRELLLDLAAANPRIVAHTQLPSLTGLMLQADLSIGAGGATTWERLCLRLPGVVVTLADNQRPVAAEMQRRGFAIWAGDAEDLADDSLTQLLDRVLGEDVDGWFNASSAQIVDGRGVDRVVAAMIAEENQLFTCRRVTVDDEYLLFEWANDPTTRAGAFNTQSISAEHHHSWLSRRLNDDETFRLFIIETRYGAEIGQVRFEREGLDWIISYSVAREHRNRGLAARVLDAALTKLRGEIGAAIVVGRVRPENAASQRVFHRLQFTVSQVSGKAIEFRRPL
jgi:UDP-2,4-diacetamido-2,4,6-trideoxy-beta-L-altropyranose hydrolase